MQIGIYVFLKFWGSGIIAMQRRIGAGAPNRVHPSAIHPAVLVFVVSQPTALINFGCTNNPCTHCFLGVHYS
jgi:hypothetical protein